MKASDVAEYERLDALLDEVMDCVRQFMSLALEGAGQSLDGDFPSQLQKFLDRYNYDRAYRLDYRQRVSAESKEVVRVLEVQRKIRRRLDQFKGDKN